MNLERAIQIAVQAHAGVKDRGGKAYILHPLSVMMRVESDAEKIVAVLHDVIEDTDWTFDDLNEEGFSQEIIDALKSVTKTSDEEDYNQFVLIIGLCSISIDDFHSLKTCLYVFEVSVPPDFTWK